MKTLKVLIACEESQAVCIEFRKLGHEAYSNDILRASGGHPEWHLQMDALEAIKIMDWDLMIAFPPCTHLAVSGAAWFEQKRKDGRQQQGIDFFMEFTKTKIPRWAIENPIGIMSKIYRKPNQIVHPFYFNEPFSKSTCLWLHNLPPLFHASSTDLFNDTVTHVEPTDRMIFGNKVYTFASNKWYKSEEERHKDRSKTFPGIAKAMATQWSEYINNQIHKPR